VAGGKLALVGLSCFREGMTGTHSLPRSVDAESKKRIISDTQALNSSAMLNLMCCIEIGMQNAVPFSTSSALGF
jgi:hypothetical protein